ncbi:hypothetical protein [Microbacterium terricola]|uniref:DUF2238 domain-containing protein n=1 Tax=Microbacterium terricola TaxID=344163 RepID=A0ABM8E305_9MICO|nr:hypothetical protein [Microbacterium terricola]UYK39960.1 hypothetical protein OAU46_14905 [Microbacterium terricola]BDV32357.1 hypothetical protein Microterr_30170 [Microbacterium terricola]
MTTTQQIDRPSVGARARYSARLALPFQVGSVALAIALSLLGFPVQPWLAVLLVPALAAPLLVEAVFRTTIPWPLQLHYLIFITAGPFAGSSLNVYGAIADWDTWVHFDSGVMLAWLGMLFVLRAEEHVRAALPLWFSLTVIALTPMAFAAAWEICEFASDVLIGTASQAGGLKDTMADIVAGTLGGLLAIAIAALFGRPRTLLPAALAARD